MRVAAYARYSTDYQREASLEDQLRNCRTYAERQGWPAPTVYKDAAITGARRDRPGYQALLADAHRFDVILVDDLSRLSRDSVESQQAVRRLTFAGVRLVGVSDGVDTGRKSHKADVGLRGLMSELYLDDLADKTHRGLTGRALAGASAGGLPYGYRVAEVGARAIDPDQADIVRRIFAEYAAGISPRDIAAGLNRDRVPSPRGSTWALTAIRGDVKRGVGILANPIYVGRQIWNRSRWVKHPDTGRRIRQERPESEWIITDTPELAIVTPEMWAAAQARQRGRSKATGTVGRPPRHVLSGILRCGECGGPLVVVDRYNYGCNRAKDRGTCKGIKVNRQVAERSILGTLRAELASDEAYARFQRAVARHLKQATPDTTAITRRLADATRVRDNVMTAIRAGIITPSTKAELTRAEADIANAQQDLTAAKAYQPAVMIPRLRERWNRIIDDLADRARESNKAREAVRQLIGTAVVRNENGDLVAEIAASSDAQITMVAGVGFEPTTFGL